MQIDQQEFQLACAILPGLMSRHGQDSYLDTDAIYEAFCLSRDCLNELRKTSEHYGDSKNAHQHGKERNNG